MIINNIKVTSCPRMRVQTTAGYGPPGHAYNKGKTLLPALVVHLQHGLTNLEYLRVLNKT